ncbi:hypothetical protein [Luteolibacter sp. Populi]|uniref:hypothetical protein n=1 Tax=Luteolibacter sp. Populi TaxID=3230487 RepID=UPI003467E5F8
MQWIILISGAPLDFEELAGTYRSLGEVQLQTSPPRLMVQGGSLRGSFVFNQDSRVGAAFSDGQLAMIRQIIPVPSFSMLQFRFAEDADAAISRFIAHGPVLVDNDQGLLLSLEEIKHRIAMGQDWLTGSSANPSPSAAAPEEETPAPAPAGQGATPALPVLPTDALPDELHIFLKQAQWPALLDAVSHLLGTPGTNDSDEITERHCWTVFGLHLIAVNVPDLQDDHGIPFSTFSSGIALDHRFCSHSPQEDAYRQAFAILLLLRLRSELDPEALLVRNLQQIIAPE